MPAIFMPTDNGDTMRILNQPGTQYDMALWERLKSGLGLTDQELADRLNNE